MPGTVAAGSKPAGVILAGGRSRRMGGVPKALLPLAGKPLLQHVIDRVAPQVGDLFLSVEQPSETMTTFGLPQLQDPQPDAGPLAGLFTALQKAGPDNEWLLLVPCDAPFLPPDLAIRLLNYARESGLPAAAVVYRSEIQPTFSIWNRSILQRLEQAVFEQQMAGFKQFMDTLEVAPLEWACPEPSPFFNINDPDALRQAGLFFES